MCEMHDICGSADAQIYVHLNYAHPHRCGHHAACVGLPRSAWALEVAGASRPRGQVGPRGHAARRRHPGLGARARVRPRRRLQGLLPRSPASPRPFAQQPGGPQEPPRPCGHRGHALLLQKLQKIAGALRGWPAAAQRVPARLDTARSVCLRGRARLSCCVARAPRSTDGDLHCSSWKLCSL